MCISRDLETFYVRLIIFHGFYSLPDFKSSASLTFVSSLIFFTTHNSYLTPLPFSQVSASTSSSLSRQLHHVFHRERKAKGFKNWIISYSTHRQMCMSTSLSLPPLFCFILFQGRCSIFYLLSGFQTLCLYNTFPV